MSDTIFAQATAPGRAGVAIIRISGPRSDQVAVSLTGRPVTPRRPFLREIRDPVTGDSVDRAILISFSAPASYTGEDVLEIQCHGSLAVVCRILSLLAACEGCRLARPGEFTRRALENGRMDLTQVEGLGDLLSAETEAQRRQAIALSSGALSARIETLRGTLVESLSLLEAVIDFGDDGVPETALDEVPARLDGALSEMEGLLAGAEAAERVREGFAVAICGEPNVGKSTLLNAIAGREVALTSEIAGTTRDVLEVHLDLRGLPVTLLDTAGLRDSPDQLERLGIERAKARASAADLRIFLVEGSGDAFEKHFQDGDIILKAKGDLYGSCPPEAVSGLTGQGVDALLARVADTLEPRAAAASGLAHERQRTALAGSRSAILRAREFLSGSGEVLDLAAFELRNAIRQLDLLSGRIDSEAVLDHIFRSFCLGK